MSRASGSPCKETVSFFSTHLSSQAWLVYMIQMTKSSWAKGFWCLHDTLAVVYTFSITPSLLDNFLLFFHFLFSFLCSARRNPVASESSACCCWLRVNSALHRGQARGDSVGACANLIIRASSYCPCSPVLSFRGHPETAAGVPGHMVQGGLAWLCVRNVQWEESTPQQAWDVSPGREDTHWKTPLGYRVMTRTSLFYIHVSTSVAAHCQQLWSFCNHCFYSQSSESVTLSQDVTVASLCNNSWNDLN